MKLFAIEALSLLVVIPLVVSVDKVKKQTYGPPDYKPAPPYNSGYYDPYYNKYGYPAYSFGYEVADPYHQNFQSRHETRDGHVVKGEYRTLLPDGRTQIVSYVADQYGYRPQVNYIGVAKYDKPYPSYQYVPKPVYAGSEPNPISVPKPFAPTPKPFGPFPGAQPYPSPSGTAPKPIYVVSAGPKPVGSKPRPGLVIPIVPGAPAIAVSPKPIFDNFSPNPFDKYAAQSVPFERFDYRPGPGESYPVPFDARPAPYEQRELKYEGSPPHFDKFDSRPIANYDKFDMRHLHYGKYDPQPAFQAKPFESAIDRFNYPSFDDPGYQRQFKRAGRVEKLNTQRV